MCSWWLFRYGFIDERSIERIITYSVSGGVVTSDIKKLVIDGFSGKNAQRFYIEKARDGLWSSEKYFIDKYFKNEKGTLLDIGCGTGRTTILLFKEGFDVVGVDVTPVMIQRARSIANSLGLKIDYRVGDATALQFKNDTFDYVFFSEQGWTQIPGRGNRLNALKEAHRVLKSGGVFMFTAHPRVWRSNYFFFWLKQWFKFFILKRFGVPIEEQEYGDRFFERETKDAQKTYDKKQYIHIPSIIEVTTDIKRTKFNILEVNGEKLISKDDSRAYPPVFYVCRK